MLARPLMALGAIGIVSGLIAASAGGSPGGATKPLVEGVSALSYAPKPFYDDLTRMTVRFTTTGRAGPGREYFVVLEVFGRDTDSESTAVIGPEGRPLEIQVRTREMHEEAEYGVAAHWLYKHKRGRGAKTDDEWVNWVKSLMDSQQEDQDPREYMRNLRTDLFADEVYVFTPKGEVKVLPAGASPIDFAYAVHTDVGHRTVGAR